MATLLTGGTGFVGQRLINHLDDLILTSRNRASAVQRLGNRVQEVIQWDPSQGPPNLSPDTPIQSVVNLMGDSIADGRWTAAKKQSIQDSRILGTQRLIEGVLTLKQKPKVFVSASAVGIYGDPGEAVVDENHRHGAGFLTEVSQAWEAAADEISNHGVRVVKLRIGIVLGQHGGALEKMIPLFRLGLGGKLGSGKQWFPWIHVDDLCRMIRWAIETPSANGVYNATAPNPVSNSEFTAALARAVGRWAILPAPKFGLKLALGEFADSLFFSQRVVPKKFLDEGFEFSYANLPAALTAIIEE